MDTNISEEKTVVNTRVKEIDIMRGLAIFLVVLGHAIIVYPINLHEITWCKTLHDLIYSFHMELFFVISGWCFKYNGNRFSLKTLSVLFSNLATIVLPERT